MFLSLVSTILIKNTVKTVTWWNSIAITLFYMYCIPVMSKLNFQQPFPQSSVSHDPEISLIYRIGGFKQLCFVSLQNKIWKNLKG